MAFCTSLSEPAIAVSRDLLPVWQSARPCPPPAILCVTPITISCVSMDSSNSPGDSPGSWLAQLRDKKLVQWAVAYVAGAWLLQVLDTVGPRWGLTDGAWRVLDIALIAGFFVALVVAWYHGEKGRQRISGPELLIVSALLFIGGLALQLLPGHSDTEAPTAKEAQPLASAGDAPGPLQSIAILPFDNYSPDPEDAYFSAGITEEITNQLAWPPRAPSTATMQ